ncbi:MAG: Crp/Fnr family transcriptional regulator [Flavobacteriaceae bacterium]
MQNIGSTGIPLQEVLSENSLEQIKAILSPMYFKKGALLINDATVEKDAYIIQKGIVKASISTPDSEVVFWFAKEGDIINSAYGYYFQRKGYENFHVLEDSILLKIDILKMQRLYTESLEISNWSRMITERDAIRSEERYLDYILLSPEERYLKLMATEPELFQRVRLKEIASYIGISPVSLSRIRARVMK